MNNRHKAILFALAIPAFISGASVFAADVVPDISLRFELEKIALNPIVGYCG